MVHTTFDNNFGNFSLNVTKFGMLSNIVDIDRSHDFCWYRDHFAGNSINTTTRVLNHISLKRAGHHHSDKVCVVCV